MKKVKKSLILLSLVYLTSAAYICAENSGFKLTEVGEMHLIFPTSGDGVYKTVSIKDDENNSLGSICLWKSIKTEKFQRINTIADLSVVANEELKFHAGRTSMSRFIKAVSYIWFGNVNKGKLVLEKDMGWLLPLIIKQLPVGERKEVSDLITPLHYCEFGNKWTAEVTICNNTNDELWVEGHSLTGTIEPFCIDGYSMEKKGAWKLLQVEKTDRQNK